MKVKKEWKPPEVQEVKIQEDSTSMDCQGKRIGCYAGSSCGSVEIKNPLKPAEEPDR